MPDAGKQVAERDVAEVTLPWSGEVVDVSTLRGQVAALAEANAFYDQLRNFQSEMKRRITEESDRLGQRTIHLEGGLTAVVDSAEAATEIVWDVEELDKLTKAGLPAERMAQLVTYEPKVDKRVANELSRNPKYARIIKRASRITKPKSRSVTVKVKGA